MCKTHSRVWEIELAEELGETSEIDEKVYIGLPKKKALHLYLKASWETCGAS